MPFGWSNDQPSTHIIMDSALWEQLPLELLSIIIEKTADSNTLRAWREATNHSARLHRLAIQATYSTFTICEKDLLRAPKSPRHHEWNISWKVDRASDRSHSLADQPRRQLILNLKRWSYQNLAPHVRRLYLQFYFASSDRQKDLVRSEDVRRTLDTILPGAKALQEIDHHGVLYQEELDGIFEVRSLKLLRVRQSWNDMPCSCSERMMPRSRRLWALDWSRLFHLHALRTLSVSQLHIYEAVGLAKAVKKLRKLENLRVEIGKFDVQTADTLFVDDADLPLMRFMNALYCNEEHTNEDLGFPSSLKALALVKVHYGHLDISRLPNDLVTPLPNLTMLYLDLFDSKEITDLFAFLNPQRLIHLLVSAYPKPEMSRTRSLYNTCRHCDTFSGLLSQNSSTLREITLLDAWQDTREDGADIEPLWTEDMPLRQLYISKPSRRTGLRIRVRPEISNTLAWRLHGGVKSGDSDRKPWGKDIRHMRIDQLDLAKLELSPIDQAIDKFRRLKILILRSLPEQVRYEPPKNESRSTQYPYLPTGASVLRSAPYPYLPYGPSLPKDMADLREGQIAMEIAAQDLPSLRVIVVGEYKFWLQRLAEECDQNDRRPKTWFLRHALEDPEQEAAIAQVMDREDWAFMADRADCLPERAPMEQVRWSNRLIYRHRE